MEKQDISKFIKKITDTVFVATAVGDAVTDAAGKAQDAIFSTTKKINDKVEEKKTEESKAWQERYNTAIEPLLGTDAEIFITSLGDSPIELMGLKVSQLHSSFPIPRE